MCPVEVKIKIRKRANFVGRNRNDTEEPRRKQAETRISCGSTGCLLCGFASKPDAANRACVVVVNSKLGTIDVDIGGHPLRVFATEGRPLQ